MAERLQYAKQFLLLNKYPHYIKTPSWVAVVTLGVFDVVSKVSCACRIVLCAMLSVCHVDNVTILYAVFMMIL